MHEKWCRPPGRQAASGPGLSVSQCLRNAATNCHGILMGCPDPNRHKAPKDYIRSVCKGWNEPSTRRQVRASSRLGAQPAAATKSIFTAALVVQEDGKACFVPAVSGTKATRETQTVALRDSEGLALPLGPLLRTRDVL